MLNSPLHYIDPTGHSCADFAWEEGCGPGDEGSSWTISTGKKLDQPYTFSAYVFADEAEFSGPLVPVPGVSGLSAKRDFLFSSSGVVMQGTGIVRNGGKPVHIHVDNPNDLDWVDKDQRVVVWTEDGWTYKDTCERAPTPTWVQDESKVRFRAGPGRKGLTPRVSVAAPNEFPLGTMLFAPALAPFTPSGGVFMVQDRGGSIITGRDEGRFDVFVGTGFRPYIDWTRIDARNGTTVFQLVVDEGGTYNGMR